MDDHDDGVSPKKELQQTTHKGRYLRIFLKALGIGTGIGVGLAGVVAGFIWYGDRPKPPKPWDKKALTAEYDYIDTFGPEHHLSFCYAIQNNTDLDYNFTDTRITHLSAVLEQEKGLSEQHEDFLKGVYPTFIPAKGRGRFCIHAEYPAKMAEPVNPTKDERHEFHRALEKFVEGEMTNLNGFELFDEAIVMRFLCQRDGARLKNRRPRRTPSYVSDASRCPDLDWGVPYVARL